MSKPIDPIPPSTDATVKLSRDSYDLDSDERFPVMRVAAGPDMLAYMVLDDDYEAVVGRDPAADLVLQDGSVSRRHAAFRCRGDHRCTVRDLGSTNGVSFEGELVASRVLVPGDCVLVGSVLLRFEVLALAEFAHLRRVNQKLRSAVHRDPLTNLHLRSAIDDDIPVLMASSQRAGAGFCVAFIDLDHFKNINDTHGHAVGDQVLEQVARIGLHRCRDADVLVRYGGEELVLFMPGAVLQGAEASAERLRQAIRQHPWEETAADLAVTASFGVAQRCAGEPLEALLERADQAMYQAKAAGRDRVVVAG